MKLTTLNSYNAYKKMMTADREKKREIYRYELMLPFEGKWDCYHIPMNAVKKGGYDVLMASDMLGILSPEKVDSGTSEWIEALADPKLWKTCTDTIQTALQRFETQGIELKVSEYLYSVLLADPGNPYIRNSQGYCGDGGIPGYILAWLKPDPYTVYRLPAALAHETNHNVRYQHIRWRNDITLGEMLVSEGLAENFAVSMFGEGRLGPWVTTTDPELLPLIKEIVREGFSLTGLENISAYLYGDELARLQNYPEAGLPYCAGYALGYDMIRYYLSKTGIPIEQATVLSAEEILREIPEFWIAEV